MKYLFALGLLLSGYISGNSQLEKIIVEKYYISDQNDATNTIGGVLLEGSVTYRIFADLQEGYKINKIYGDDFRPFIIESTQPFYNHNLDGVSVGYLLNKNRLKENLVSLDSWITIGQATRASGGSALFGTLKEMDKDGSIIGGNNNDGGSASVAGGLLRNKDTSIGSPLTETDGYFSSTLLPTNWFVSGLVDNETGVDTTIFGQNKTHFRSSNFILQSASKIDTLDVQNKVLIAQLTTKGELSFKLNLEVEDINGVKTNLVYRDSLLNGNMKFTSILTYPPLCGCLDSEYLEYSSEFSCADNSKCINRIVFGCLDSLACNYNRLANFHLSTLCCYIGYCNDNNITIICPDLPPRITDDNYITISPNPTLDYISFNYSAIISTDSELQIYNLSNKLVFSAICRDIDLNHFDISFLDPGCYFLKIQNGEKVLSKRIIKL
jgi:hypothetical protein